MSHRVRIWQTVGGCFRWKVGVELRLVWYRSRIVLLLGKWLYFNNGFEFILLLLMRVGLYCDNHCFRDLLYRLRIRPFSPQDSSQVNNVDRRKIILLSWRLLNFVYLAYVWSLVRCWGYSAPDCYLLLPLLLGHRYYADVRTEMSNV